jgi:hypothetical protein
MTVLLGALGAVLVAWVAVAQDACRLFKLNNYKYLNIITLDYESIMVRFDSIEALGLSLRWFWSR